MGLKHLQVLEWVLGAVIHFHSGDLELGLEGYCHNSCVVWQVSAKEQLVHGGWHAHPLSYFHVIIPKFSKLKVHLAPFFLSSGVHGDT